jgi:hypothetical protein
MILNVVVIACIEYETVILSKFVINARDSPRPAMESVNFGNMMEKSLKKGL